MEEFKQPEKKIGMAGDLEIVLTLIKHIENPCKDEAGHNLRKIYLNEAKNLLPTLKDSDIKKLLEGIIKTYEK